VGLDSVSSAIAHRGPGSQGGGDGRPTAYGSRLLSFAQVMDRLRHPHPSLPLKGEGIEGRGQCVALLMRRSVTAHGQRLTANRLEIPDWGTGRGEVQEFGTAGGRVKWAEESEWPDAIPPKQLGC